jgi:signal transduction histidine kinase
MRLRQFLPRQISAQLAALVIVSSIIFHGVMTSAFFFFPPDFSRAQFEHEEASRPFDEGPIDPDRPPPPFDERHHPRPPTPPIMGRLAPFILLSICLGVLVLWATRAIVAPLKTFVTAAEQYRASGSIALLNETGPSEIRSLARALNDMQSRITELMTERTRMLAAIGHDLRTPITRLRLRAEFMTNTGEQRRMLADLDHMEALVRAALLHLQEGKTEDNTVVTDLSSLLQTVADQFGELETEIGYSGPQQVVVRIKPHEFQRAVTNLVENAARYGKDPQIHVERAANGDLEIRVEDSGPGISDDLKAAMQEPFARGDKARSMNEFEGFGLGLSIARSIAETHGGRLELRDRDPGGLAAVIVLPASAIVWYKA